MSAATSLADRFEEHRPHVRAVAYRLLGSLSEADDAVQQTWLRLQRVDPDEIDNLGGWLTTVVSRLCLDMLRARRARPEVEIDAHLPDPVVTAPEVHDPEAEAVLADSVGLALQVVLDRLKPAERLAFVLHDMFAVPFEDVAELLGRTPAAVRQLASRARRRVADTPAPERDRARQRAAADAFLTAARAGDFDALVAVLDPDVVLHADGGAARPEISGIVRGPATIAQRALAFRTPGVEVRPVLVNGVAGALATLEGRPVTLFAFTLCGDRIVRLDILGDPDRLAALPLPA
ncbi:MAG TPA: sigma-70 family RNA polymerase sigma factor [Acidimicrobiales bacterium]